MGEANFGRLSRKTQNAAQPRKGKHSGRIRKFIGAFWRTKAPNVVQLGRGEFFFGARGVTATVQLLLVQATTSIQTLQKKNHHRTQNRLRACRSWSWPSSYRYILNIFRATCRIRLKSASLGASAGRHAEICT
jgi:hypothetical protein